MLLVWVLTVLMAITSVRATVGVGHAARDQAQHFQLARAEWLYERAVG